MTGTGRRRRYKTIGELLGHLGREECGVRVGEPIDLLMHCAQHVRMPMPQTGHCGAATGIHVAPPLVVNEIHTFAPYRTSRRVSQLTM